jgi:cold shock CspA family protein
METELTESIERKPIVYGEKLQGKIIKLMTEGPKRGYGFITSESREYVKFFFHWSALRQETLNFKDLAVGMKVSFIEAKTDRGNRAVQIEVI